LNRILLPIDFSERSVIALQYAYLLGQQLGLPLTLLNCYPIQEHLQRFDFGELSYDKGIRAKLSDFYSQHTDDEDMESVRFLARAGSPTEKIIALSESYQLIVTSSKVYNNTLDRWLGSKVTVIATKSKCPVLIIPAQGIFKNWDTIWRIKRHEKELTITPAALTQLGITPSNIRIKTLDQEDFTSSFWQLIVSYMQTQEPKLLTTIREVAQTEQVDLLLLQNDQARNSLSYFLNSDALQVIFQLSIPVLIFQKNILGD